MSMKTRVSAYTLSIALVCSTGALAQQKAKVFYTNSKLMVAAFRILIDRF